MRKIICFVACAALILSVITGCGSDVYWQIGVSYCAIPAMEP